MAGTSYTRQSTIADGNIITAALFNNEFNQLLNAFAYASSGTTGHTHDGSAGQGAAISKIGDQDFNNKVVISATNNRIEFYCEVSGSPVEQVRIQDGAIVPVTDSDVDLGTTSVRFKDAYVDSATVTGTVSAATVTSTGTTNIVTGVVTGDMTFTGAAYNAVWDSSTNTMRFADNAVMAVGDSSELKIYHDGSDSYIKEAGTGSLYITADTNIFMGSSFGAYSFSVDATNGTTTRVGGVTTLTVDSDGVTVPDNVKINLGSADDLQIYHDGSNSYIKDAGTGNLNIQASTDVFIGTTATTMANFDSTGSVDLYYNNSKKFETTSSGATITGSLGVTTVNATALLATSNIDTPQIEVTSLRARDGSVAGTIADSTGVITLNSAVLTTADINGGTIDGATIGGSTPAAGTFTTINGTTSTVTTSNATTVDTTNLEVTNLKAKDGTSAGSIADSTGVVTLASSVLTTADINGGTADNVVIGGSTAAAGTFTAVTATASSSITGSETLSTDPIATINRTGNDGVILELQQDGTTTAEFFSTSGDRLILCDNTGDGIKFTPTSIMPRTSTNGAYDNSMDLGLDSSRFRDAYIGGGVYLGGTAAANKFDDYEEGTWTPEYKGATTDPVYTQDGLTAGRYTKIGNIVHAIGRIRTDALTDAGSGQLAITLPVSVMNDGSIDKQFGVLVIGEAKTFNSNFFPHGGWASLGTTRAYIVRRTASAGQTQSLDSNDALATADNSNDLVFSITYLTD